jgi:DUF4097 and DUF4098 domain-containing protein YvlB
MSNYVTYPAEGITHLIIEEMARDAQVRGAADATAIQVIHAGGEPEFIAEGEAVRLQGAAIGRVFVPAGLAVTVKRANGDLRAQDIAGDVSLEAVHGDLRLTGLAGIVRIAQADGDLRAEATADLRVLGACAGDLRCENGGAVSVEAVSGDLRLYNVGEVRANRVAGDLWAERLAGGLQVTRADGDARLSEIAGPVKLQALAGDLRASGLTGGLAAPHVSGDALLHGPFTADEGYALTAEGDVGLHLPADADLRLSIRAGGRVRSDPRLTPAADGTPTFAATLGRGTGRIVLDVAGDLRITQAGVTQGPEFRAGRISPEGRARLDDLSNLGERIRQQVAASLASAGIDGERIRQQVAASLAAAGINVETGEFSLGRDHSRGPRVKPPRPPEPPRSPERPRPPSPPAPPMEEQMAILRMVEAGQITAEEAEKLLKALGT